MSNVRQVTDNSKGKCILFITAVVVLPCVALFLMRERILLAVGDFLVVRDELQPADVIHVISGPDDRTDHAIRLYHQGYGDQIFFTGDWCATIQANHAEHGRERAIAQGVPPQAIAIDGSRVMSTYSETVKLREYIATNQLSFESVIVVSDPFHMRRARWTYEQVLGDEFSIQMAPVPFDLLPYQRRWWRHGRSREYVKNEYVKIAYYYARYKLAVAPLDEWLASLDRD